MYFRTSALVSISLFLVHIIGQIMSGSVPPLFSRVAAC
jgi:hypothetical protein